MTNYREEETLLSPEQTRVRFEAKIVDSEYLVSPNGYGEYKVTLMPLTVSDSHSFFEAAEHALSTVEMTKSSYSMKEVSGQYEDRYGNVIANQLFAPKLNLELYHPMMYTNMDASICAHFRDLSSGAVCLNIEYIDFYEIEDPEPRPQNRR